MLWSCHKNQCNHIDEDIFWEQVENTEGINKQLITKGQNTKDEKEQRYIQTCPCGHLY
jgi:hypothetical protein